MQSSGTNYYFSYDHLGSVREVTDPNGNVISRYDYDPYGRLTVNQGVPPRLGFAGMYDHQPSGLGLTEYRAYDPNLGRWESRDLVESNNAYIYALSDPIDNLDPLGLDVTVCFYSDAAGGFGHIGYGVTGETSTQGFYPKKGGSGPGIIKPDTQKVAQCLRIPTPPFVDQCLKQCRADRAANPGNYNLLNRQCTSFVRDCLKACGINTTMSSSPEPGDLFNYLLQGYPSTPGTGN